ncbi:Rieske [2Fe-2S] domain-containing protein [Arboricoccus pini]|uniref:Rieske [2Fe-2S] domain-containing protein n=1 Tax=Arboricoccus pini TaxID=1963835 RepID=A0A212RZA6_9PROT|nr:FAD-dependent oxidoreductase [Arboricoccus pini]SNB78178.1 Rieske [2Fe-2S] domain-containing protein [Arboricoccus pini]
MSQPDIQEAQIPEVSVAVDEIPRDGFCVAGSGKAKALFVRTPKGVAAFQATCPHYGLPLDAASLCDGRLYCPFHKASFAMTDGRLIDPPALHGLDRYPVRQEHGRAIARLEKMKRGTDAVGTLDPSAANTRFLIVGSGAAATAAATTMRRRGFVGEILMIGQEADPPYDRPSLSKDFIAGPLPDSAVWLEGQGFYERYGLSYVEGQAERIDIGSRRVTLADGRHFEADALLVATGSRPRMPAIPGVDLAGVLTLRSLADARQLARLAAGQARLVIVGGGFIAVEASVFLGRRGIAVTILSAEAAPLADRLGPDVAGAVLRLVESRGVRVERGARVVALEGQTAVRGVRLDDGRLLEASHVLMAAGAVPATDMLVGARLEADRGVRTDAYLAIGDSVYAAGDIAAYPDPLDHAPARVEHWRAACQQGMQAGLNMMGHLAPFQKPPFFWSNIAGQGLDAVGRPAGYERLILKGDPDRQDFIAYYIKGGRAIAASGMNRKAELIAFMHLMETGRLPDPTFLGAERSLQTLVQPWDGRAAS